MIKRFLFSVFCFLFSVFCIIIFLASCENDSQEKWGLAIEGTKSSTPKLTRFVLLQKDNPEVLMADAECSIVGDSIVECWIFHATNNKKLTPVIDFQGEYVTLDHQHIGKNLTSADFTHPVSLSVYSQNQRKDYTVYVYSFSELPVLYIETENRKPITSKDEYLNASLKFVGCTQTAMRNTVFESQVRIKGRGNSSWEMPKQSYRLSFNEKVSFFNEPKDKSWILVANYSDKTLLRNQTAYYIGSLSNLEYTPRFHFVDLILNGRYNGTYQLGDKLKISKNRVNVGDDGFLLEIDSRAPRESDSRYFYTKHLFFPVNIKEPSVEYDSADYLFAQNFVSLAEETLFSDNFRDPEEGWQKNMDIDSFVDWYLVNEITKNNDACLFSSCFMNFKRGGKLKMGPLWDFDLAFGNTDVNNMHDPTGFWIKNTTWFSRLFQDPAFVSQTKTRFKYFYAHKKSIRQYLRTNAQLMQYSIIENNNRWNILNSQAGYNHSAWENYQNELLYMDTWLDQRFEWLKDEFEKM